MVIRVPVLYGPGNFQESAVLYMYKQVVDGEDCYVDHIQQRVPTLTTDIAKTIRNLIESKCSLRGIVHLSAEVVVAFVFECRKNLQSTKWRF